MKAVPLALGFFAVVALQEAPRTISVRGTISETGGTGIEDVHVGIGSASTRTASDGTFTIENIPPGEHVISISRSGYLLAGRTSLNSTESPSSRNSQLSLLQLQLKLKLNAYEDRDHA